MERTVGYIGMGVMGLPFAAHLRASGHRVLVFDRDPAALRRAQERGLAAVGSQAELIERVDMLFTCLPDPDAVAEVYRGIAKPGLVACDNSTIGPAQARTLHGRLREAGVGYVECPMLGGVAEAEAGSLFPSRSPPRASIGWSAAPAPPACSRPCRTGSGSSR
jgi:3-hydroxyisobutyrate dehydrogenase-like beta-hydroxyacid dehydrogenase